MAGFQNVCRPVDNLSFDKNSSIGICQAKFNLPITNYKLPNPIHNNSNFLSLFIQLFISKSKYREEKRSFR